MEAIATGVRRQALFHYDQDYTDTEIDVLVARAREEITRSNATLELAAATEGATLYL